MSTLIARVSPSCARVGEGCREQAGANASMTNRAADDGGADAERATTPRARCADARRRRRAGTPRVYAHCARARRAQAAQSPKMSTTCSASREAVQRGGALRPLLDVGRLDLDGQPARAADQVVVVPGRRAGAVEALALGALQRVGLALRGESGERAVDGGQADAGVLVAQRGVQASARSRSRWRRRAPRAPARAATCSAARPWPGFYRRALCRRLDGCRRGAVMPRLVTRPRRLPTTRQTR